MGLDTSKLGANSPLTAEYIKGSNNFTNTNEMRARFTVSSADGVADFTDFFVMPGSGNAAGHTLPTGVTYSGDFPTVAELWDYLEKNKLWLAYIRIQTSDPDNNFSQKLTFGTRLPNNNVQAQIRDYNYTDFRETTGNGYQDTLNITNADLGGGVLLRAATFIKQMQIAKGTNITYWFGISHTDSEYELKSVAF